MAGNNENIVHVEAIEGLIGQAQEHLGKLIVDIDAGAIKTVEQQRAQDRVSSHLDILEAMALVGLRKAFE